MGLLAAHLNDADITVVNAEGVVYREPGFALLEDSRLVTGAAAYSAARYKPRQIHKQFWSDLQTDALSDRRFHHLSAADLVSQQLEDLWRRVAQTGDRLALAVPHTMSSENLGLLLGITVELNIPIVAMVDSAVAATRREYRQATPVHIDFGLHTALLTRLGQSSAVQIDRSRVIDDAGTVNLYDLWIKMIATEFVQQSRFDPLHTAETEQMLQDRMPGWLAAASSGKSVAMAVEYGGISHGVEIEALEFAAAAAPVYQNIVSNLRALLRADEVGAIQLSARAAQFPGLAEILKARVGGEVFILEVGATARGVLSRCREHSTESAVSLLRRLPWDQAAIDVHVDSEQSNNGQPTHLLFGSHAYSLGAQPLALGNQAADGERCLDLPQDMPGVSRRHCVLSIDNGQTVLTDHSRYGTYLNGHRIEGSALLQTGDLVRIGTPGFEFRLIETEASGGA